MAAIILGYRSDRAFMTLYSYLFLRAIGPDWLINWASEAIDMHGNGILRFGQIKKGDRSEGISLVILNQYSHALEAAKADKRRHNVLFATAIPEQLQKLTLLDRSADKGYAVIKDGAVPLLSEYQHAVLVWGGGWTGKAAEPRIASLFDEMVRTFIFPEEVILEPPVIADGDMKKTPGPDELAELEGCG